MNPYEAERKVKADAIENFMVNLSPETVEQIRSDIARLPESGYKRFCIECIEVVQGLNG